MLPIETLIDIQEAVSDWKFTTQEASQIIYSVWQGVIGALLFAGMMRLFNIGIGKNK